MNMETIKTTAKTKYATISEMAITKAKELKVWYDGLASDMKYLLGIGVLFTTTLILPTWWELIPFAIVVAVLNADILALITGKK